MRLPFAPWPPTVTARLRLLRDSNLFAGMVLLLLLAAVAKSAWDMAVMLLPHARGAMENDTLIYLTLGRGMLNGLAPYRDLFESKPPGMYLLSVASLLVTGGPGLITVTDVLALLLIAVLPAAFALANPGSARGWRQKGVAAATVLLIGVQLALYLEERAGPAQTEVFGSLAGSLYILHVLWSQGSVRPRAVLVNAALLLAAVGLKEPFLLTVFAAALLVVEHPRTLVGVFLVPLLVAGPTGLLALAVLGIATDYFKLYLPAMLLLRVTSSPVEPVFTRGFSVAKVLYNLTTAYTNPAFGVLLATLWLLFPCWKAPKTSAGDVALTAAAAAAGYVFLAFTWVILVFLHAITVFHLEWDVPFVVGKLTQHLGLAVTLGVLLFLQRRRARAAATVVGLASLLPVATALGIGGYLSAHFAFAGPYYFALVLVFARAATAASPNRFLTSLIACLAALTTFLYRPSPEHQQYVARRLQYSYEQQRPAVERLDALLDACGDDRYVSSTGVFQRLAFARHSPVGPVFNPAFHKYLRSGHPLFQATADNIRREARVAVVASGATFEPPYALVLASFSKEAPACAKPFLPIPGLDVWFRPAE